MTIPNRETARSCWDWFKQNTDLSDVAIAAILGNFWAESAFLPNNLENRMNLQLNMNDDEYCRQVNAGTYRYKDHRTARESFAHDTGGFGLAQWTLSSRKDELYTRTVGSGKPVEDLSVQCGLAWAELIRDFPGVYKLMHNSPDLRACTVEFLFKFENPAVKSADVQNLRTKYAQNIYDAFHGVPAAAPEKPSREKQLIAEIRERLDELEGLANA